MLARRTSSLLRRNSVFHPRKQGERKSTSTRDDRDYQLLQNSPVKTSFFQPSLPRLPIPKLSLTCERYLASQRPLLSSQQLRDTTSKVDSFLQRNGEGRRLDARLRDNDRQNKHTSYISGPWTKMYLEDRRSVVFHHSPGIAFTRDTRQGPTDPTVTATGLLISALRFYKSLRANLLLPDVYHMAPKKTSTPEFWQSRVRYFPNALAAPLAYLYKVFPLDMYQFQNLFQSTRIPGRNGDSLERFPDSRHMIVMKNGHFYKFDALDSSYNLYPPFYYLSCINQVAQSNVERGPGVGVLTTEDRSEWFEARQNMASLGANASVLQTIDSALFVMCLDDWTHDDLRPEVTVKNLVCGPDPSNRWFDKSFSLIFSKNGLSGINFEHSWGDGVAVMRLVDEIVTDSMRNKFVGEGDFTSDNLSHGHVERLHFTLNEKLQEAINNAERKYFSRLNAVSFDVLQFENFGREACQIAGLGPDSVMQLAFQIAYHKLTGNFVPTYESCSTAIFKHGRTETLRPGTIQTKACTKAFNLRENNVQKSNAELFRLMKECSKIHNELAKLAARGHGWDRHLFALRMMALSETNNLPDIFTDQAYVDINQNIISTSTLSSLNMSLGGFCPVVKKGYGLGYQIQKERVGVIISSFVGETSGLHMKEALFSTLEEIQNIIKQSKK